ncbi:Hypothetical protein RBRH_04306 (plasmid) [Mycetohabitans rhizoxinica HKI 454]|uniref:Uncharacterized protein n=1 Tax=Mycetohabitans rhizoxinica (strain DSM 19002 / CIP 109453 / HKI 454) TaxID=882378 RepID=E5AW97_MYCRK|nr:MULTISPECIES: DUF6516 family protein [Mycetohabitans]CBW77399.1 Hypothetical protein RBRH_04306 [Mycetohabitans rhizoxinica HKI 454]
MRIWRLLGCDAERPHGLKYSLFYGQSGTSVIGYGNERSQGDHRHYRDREVPYVFLMAGQMVRDFWGEVGRKRSGK